MESTANLNSLWAHVESFLMGTEELFLISALIPILVAPILWVRKQRVLLGVRTMRITFMAVGTLMLFRSAYMALMYNGVHAVLDIQSKAGIGLMVGGLVCVALEFHHYHKPYSLVIRERDVKE